MILNKGNILKESATKTPTQEDIMWLYNWLNPTKESYLKGWEDGHAYIVFGAKNKLDDDGFNPENDWGIINALIKRGFKYKLTQGDYTYKTVGTFNSRSMSFHNREFDRTLKNRVRLDIYWGDNEEMDENVDKPLEYDDDAKNEWKGTFDVASEQETANIMDKKVINKKTDKTFEPIKEGKDMNKLTEAVDRNKLAEFIKGAVEDLMNGGEGTHFFDLGSPNGLHLVVGFGDDADNYYAEDLEHLALDKSGKYVVCAKLAVNVDDMQDDFDWDWYMPFDKETGDVWDTQTTIANNEDYDAFAQDFINEFEKMKDLDIDEDGAIIEHEEVVEESKKDCDDDCEKESKLVYDALSEYQANHFDDLKDVENDFINSTIDKFAVLAGVFNDVDESCKKEGKPLKESADQDDIRSAVYNTLRIFDTDVEDILCDLVDRALGKAKRGGDVWDACMAAVDEGMTYDDDQWTAYRFYCDMGDDQDVMWESLTEDVFRVTSAILDNDDVEDDHDDEGRDDPMTGDDVWESLDNEVPMNEDELWESLNKLDDQPVADDVLDEVKDKRTAALSQSNK